MNTATVLVVEDDLSLREAMCDTLQMAGYQVTAAADAQAALRLVEKEAVGMVVSDVHMQPMDGHLLLQKLKARHPSLPVVLMTAYGNVQKAVQAMRDGASDYLVKPFEAQVLVNMVSRYLSQTEVNSALVANDVKTVELMALAERVAASDVTVVISGESGTGKEVFARHIHACSRRADQPFVAINCAAIPENMLEAVLFGYEKGAFTGAYQSSAGKFEQAQGGTLLLDEISEMALGLQAKLLRVLQEREVERLGGKKVIALDVRVLATTNRNLKEAVRAGRFREDLFYRLNVFPLQLRPLRERPGDIPALANALIARRVGAAEVTPSLSDGAQSALLAYHWPGNVRELDNVIQRALILRHGDVIQAADIHFECGGDVSPPVPAADDLHGDLKAREYQVILNALNETGSRKATALKLGISPRTLRYKLARMRDAGIELPGNGDGND